MASRLRRTFLLLLLVSFGDVAAARVWRVTPDGTGDAPTIQAAIDSASPGDEVLLSPGRYSWTSQGATGQSMVYMRSGLTLRGEAGASATILDGEDQGRVIHCENVGNEVLIDGLTIERGLAVATMSPGAGGGLYSDPNSTPTIANCIIRRNSTARGEAGGIRCTNAIVRGCQILDNRSPQDGFGVGITALGRLVISGSTIKGHHVSRDSGANGGGISAVEAEMTDCWIENNSISANEFAAGGGASIGRGTIARCVFLNNSVTAFFNSTYGGGLRASDCVVTDCVFIGNVATSHGAPGAGGAIASTRSDVTLTVVRSTIIGNRAVGPTFPPVNNIGGIAAPVANVVECIIAWNEGLPVNSTMTTSCTNFFGNTLGDQHRGVEQGGNFSADPEFCAVDPISSVSVGLQADSPCAAGQHPDGATCGGIGAGSVECAGVPVQSRTWGEIKTLYRH